MISQVCGVYYKPAFFYIPLCVWFLSRSILSGNIAACYTWVSVYRKWHYVILLSRHIKQFSNNRNSDLSYKWYTSYASTYGIIRTNFLTNACIFLDQESYSNYIGIIRRIIGYENNIQKDFSNIAFYHVNGEQIELGENAAS